MDALAEALTTEARGVIVRLDEEHNLFRLDFEDRNGGYNRNLTMSSDTVTSGDFRTLANIFRDIKELRWPATVVTREGLAEIGAEPFDSVAEDGDLAEGAADAADEALAKLGALRIPPSLGPPRVAQGATRRTRGRRRDGCRL